MGNQDSSPLRVCVGRSDQDAITSQLTSLAGDAWLSVPISQLTDKMFLLKKRSLEKRESFQDRVDVSQRD